jgi:type I restriction enzyme S subunit
MMESLNFKPWISGAAQPKLTKDRLMSIGIAVPPPEEQDRIIGTIESETAALRAAIDRARSEVNLLREFRTRLIADIVTGKLDVREVAARLPERASEAEPPDEVEDLPEDDETVEETDSETVHVA